MSGRKSARVELVGGSPLFVDGMPVAWFENWIPIERGVSDLTAREVAAIESRLRRPVRS